MRVYSIRQLLKDTRGAELVEYVVILGLVALIAIAGFKLFGTTVTNKIKGQANAVESINQSAGI
ncbi:Flp family type IVb pilin [Pajaroellobacter abortibovis]|uniref:Pilus assembly protein n=1 Tax=Pajaroellobacter abortibovis TaxID=1882918 RepID=A0A1L6MY73_9BACT|nr:hypothetical protein [Pajaroellobacter abortibovis]APS00521.1 hypothetical protein BCY86_07415 [Pajaroellobacter abortibovis]